MPAAAKLVPLDGVDGKLDAEKLDAAIAAYSPAAVFFRPAAVSITQVTELGTVYSLAELRAIADVSHRHGLKLHMDGARFANAVASQNCTLADMSWRAGVDVLSFGATKNGAIAAEAVVYFDKSLMKGAAELRKRAGMLWSKHRFLAVQWQAYLTNDLWLRLARTANAGARALANELGKFASAELVYAANANEVFVRLPDETDRPSRGKRIRLLSLRRRRYPLSHILRDERRRSRTFRESPAVYTIDESGGEPR